MVDEEAPPDGRAGMNFDAGQKAAELRDQARKQGHIPLIQEMREPVQENGMKTRIAEQHFGHTFGGGIALEDRLYLLSDLSEHVSSMAWNQKGRTMMVG
jgi:hypothetical protein